MKLQWLYLDNYRVLYDLEIDFCPDAEHVLTHAPSYSLDFLVGVNGTGKSTVLRVLFDLMRTLERNAPVEYGFALEYDLGEGDQRRRIKLSNMPEDLDSEGLESEQVSSVQEPNAWENGQPVPVSRSILPEMVVAFTTGSETAWKNLDEMQPIDSGNLEALQELSLVERAIRELPGKPPRSELLENSQVDEDSQSQFLLIEANQLSIVTLCGLLTDLAEDSEHPRLKNVLQGANISAIAGFSLKFRMTQGTTSQTDRDKVKRLAELATHTLCLGTDYLLVFDLTNPERPIAQEIIEEFTNGLQLFQILARLSNVGDDGQFVLREVNIFLERPSSNHFESEEEDDPPLHLLDWLSDGERSFLGRMCLFTLLGETEALILLDEPEVHFNDAWKRQIVSLLDKTIEGRQSHVLITTHSSITLTDVPQEDILVLDRNGSYTSSAFNPGIRTLAANPNDIMKYIFGAPYPSGARGITYIERVLEGISDLAPVTQKKEIENLLDKIGPGYWYSVVQNKLRALERSSEQR